jgi:predicted peroxiredoxin
MPHLLVQVTCGPEDPTRAALAFLVARTALESGHEVTVFVVGDAVQLLRRPTLDSVVGVGTGPLRESFDAVVAGGARLLASTLSGRARGLSDSDLDGLPIQLAFPADLVAATMEADRVVTY